jgi:hypothetical protein
MDRNDKDQIAKFICYGIGCLFAYWIFMWLLPYIALFFALYAFGLLVLANNQNNRRNRR